MCICQQCTEHKTLAACWYDTQEGKLVLLVCHMCVRRCSQQPHQCVGILLVGAKALCVPLCMPTFGPARLGTVKLLARTAWHHSFGASASASMNAFSFHCMRDACMMRAHSLWLTSTCMVLIVCVIQARSLTSSALEAKVYEVNQKMEALNKKNEVTVHLMARAVHRWGGHISACCAVVHTCTCTHI